MSENLPRSKSTNCLHILFYLALAALESIYLFKISNIYIYIFFLNYVLIWHINTIKGFIFSDRRYMQLNFKALQFLK